MENFLRIFRLCCFVAVAMLISATFAAASPAIANPEISDTVVNKNRGKFGVGIVTLIDAGRVANPKHWPTHMECDQQLAVSIEYIDSHAHVMDTSMQMVRVGTVKIKRNRLKPILAVVSTAAIAVLFAWKRGVIDL